MSRYLETHIGRQQQRISPFSCKLPEVVSPVFLVFGVPTEGKRQPG